MTRRQWVLLQTAYATARATQTSRTKLIQDAKGRIEQELISSSDGDWEKWSENLSPFRSSLVQRIQKLQAFNPGADGEARFPVLESLSDPPLFEVRPAGYLDYLYLVDNISAWLKDRTALPAFAAISRWLRRQNVDYFVIPVPKLTEVYPDLMASHVPGNRIVAPHVRRLLWELLNKDVEVLDLLPRDLAARKTVRGALYYSWIHTGIRRAR